MDESKWVIIQITDVGGTLQSTAYPHTLNLQPDFQGEIVWYAFPPEFELTGVNLTQTRYAGLVAADPNRPGCFTATVLNNAPTEEIQDYTVSFRRVGETAEFQGDPVIENDPPPTPSIREDIVRKKRQRRVAASANH